MSISPLVAELERLRANRQTAKFRERPAGSLAEAYRQVALTQGKAEHLAWKLGGTSWGTRTAFSTQKPYAGPLKAEEVSQAPARLPGDLAPLRAEAELALRLGRAVIDLESLQADDLFDRWAVALEFPWSAVEDLPSAGLFWLVLDRCGAGHLFLGTATRYDGIEALPRVLTIEQGCQSLTSEDRLNTLACSPEAAVMAILEELVGFGFVFPKGTWFATGGVTECVTLSANLAVTVLADDWEALRIEPVS